MAYSSGGKVTSSGLQAGAANRLTNKIEKIKGITKHREFSIDDIDPDSVSGHETQHWIRYLKESNLIDAVDTEEVKYDDTHTRDNTVWRWRDEAWQVIQDYKENTDTLSCGCREHIPPERDGDTFYCKFCGDGVPKEEIEQCL